MVGSLPDAETGGSHTMQVTVLNETFNRLNHVATANSLTSLTARGPPPGLRMAPRSHRPFVSLVIT
jgi:hypothetical protein